MDRRAFVLVALLVLACVLGLVAYNYLLTQKTVLRVSTTTSLYATGLLERLADEFRKTHPDVVIQFIPVGSGEALRKASMGDADLVLVHAPNLEQKYINDGLLIEGGIFAYNYFVIVGPPSDPANIKGLDNATEAFRKIFEAGEKGEALFVSRGDNSGTHNRELFIWRKTGLNPRREWYIESGSGMAQTLQIANEKEAYTLSDIGTYLKLKKTGVINNLEILVSGDPDLINIYSVYIVNPKKINGIKYDLAKEFREFLLGTKGQKIIGEYGVEDYGANLFYPVDPSKLNELKSIWRYFASS